MNTEDTVSILDSAQTLAFLKANHFGRLAMILADEPHIVPVNYAWGEGDTELGTLYIRSAPGEKLFTAAVGKQVVFEVDEVRDTGATSAVVRGIPRIVSEREEITLVRELNLRPWVATRKPAIIAIDLSAVSGRDFVFGPEPQAPLEP